MWLKRSGYSSPLRWVWLLVLVVACLSDIRPQSTPLASPGPVDYKTEYEILSRAMHETLPLLRDRLPNSETNLKAALQRVTDLEMNLQQAKANADLSNEQNAMLISSLENDLLKARESAEKSANDYKALINQYTVLSLQWIGLQESYEKVTTASQRVTDALALSEKVRSDERDKANEEKVLVGVGSGAAGLGIGILLFWVFSLFAK